MSKENKCHENDAYDGKTYEERQYKGLEKSPNPSDAWLKRKASRWRTTKKIKRKISVRWRTTKKHRKKLAWIVSKELQDYETESAYKNIEIKGVSNMRKRNIKLVIKYRGVKIKRKDDLPEISNGRICPKWTRNMKLKLNLQERNLHDEHEIYESDKSAIVRSRKYDHRTSIRAMIEELTGKCRMTTCLQSKVNCVLLYDNLEQRRSRGWPHESTWKRREDRHASGIKIRIWPIATNKYNNEVKIFKPEEKGDNAPIMACAHDKRNIKVCKIVSEYSGIKLKGSSPKIKFGQHSVRGVPLFNPVPKQNSKQRMDCRKETSHGRMSDQRKYRVGEPVLARTML